MYKCLDCGHVFDEPIKVVESYEGWGRTFTEDYPSCPICYGWAFDEFDPEDIPEEEYDLLD